ncbi:Transmembrane amino acid transporter protein [Tritrichomonas foetus]|uniref:Transmembrane amino acid transporter protein n=1 Tax=Tritrichomonas foetus TaxID=1144522 RepID=A0A1J4JJW6_9EUKA|nr:Transmembrane amino acid transporter protein [Tritrichomonas foetus]|eukprot:OHS98655.1 Transmembrane amino acid transporter protein [Tritrichomonas foetus]
MNSVYSSILFIKIEYSFQTIEFPHKNQQKSIFPTLGMEIEEIYDDEAISGTKNSLSTHSIDREAPKSQGSDSSKDDEAPELGPDGLPIDKKHHSDSSAENNDDGEPPPLRIKRFATIMNIMNSLLGAGILSVPHAISYCGLVPSLIMLVIMAVLSHIGTVMTMKLAHREGSDSLDGLTAAILKKPGAIAISICSMLFCISAMVAYLVIGYGNIISWFDGGGIVIGSNLWQRALIVLIYSLILPVAMTFPRDIRFLAPFSGATVFSIVFFIVAMCIKAGMRLPYPKGEGVSITVSKFDMGIFSAISIYGLAFALPVCILPLIKPYNPDTKKRSLVSLLSCLICFICVLIPGVLGYCLFGDDVADIVLDDFSSKDILIIITRIGFFIVVTFSYPCIGQSVMASWGALIFGDSDQGNLPWSKRWLVLLLTNIIPVGFAIFLPNAGPALSIGGAFGGCLVDFFFPALMWIVISKKKWYHWQNILCILFAIFGIVSCAIATYQAIVDAIVAFK